MCLAVAMPLTIRAALIFGGTDGGVGKGFDWLWAPTTTAARAAVQTVPATAPVEGIVPLVTTQHVQLIPAEELVVPLAAT